MKRFLLRHTLHACLIALSWNLTEISSAAVIRHELSDTFGSGTSRPAGSAPWLVMTLADVEPTITRPWTVEITFAAENLTGSEYVSEWFLNFDAAVGAVGDLVVQVSDASAGVYQNPTISLGHDAFKAGPDGHYNIRLAFASGGGSSQRFGAGDVLVLGVSYPDVIALDARSFDVLSAASGAYGPYHTAAHVRSIGGSDSAWVHSVPEPSSTLWALWLAVIAVMYRHRPHRSQRSVVHDG
ncbi:MAG: hypothetical protein FJ385_06225 [Verrucomicrobia bacterium]|nr:hypothetical protein [Verrucomicrobiota bacterium]